MANITSSDIIVRRKQMVCWAGVLFIDIDIDHLILSVPTCRLSVPNVWERSSYKGQTFRSLVICLLPFQSDKHGNVLKFRGLGYMSSSLGEFSGDRPVAWSAVQRRHWLLRHCEGENCQKVNCQLFWLAAIVSWGPKNGMIWRVGECNHGPAPAFCCLLYYVCQPSG